MGTIKKGILGAFSGKVGNVVDFDTVAVKAAKHKEGSEELVINVNSRNKKSVIQSKWRRFFYFI